MKEEVEPEASLAAVQNVGHGQTANTKHSKGNDLKVHLRLKNDVRSSAHRGTAEAALAAAVAAELVAEGGIAALQDGTTISAPEPVGRSNRLPSFETIVPQAASNRRAPPTMDLMQLQAHVFDLERRLRNLETLAALNQQQQQQHLISPAGQMTAAMAATHLAAQQQQLQLQHQHHQPPQQAYPSHLMMPSSSANPSAPPSAYLDSPGRLLNAIGGGSGYPSNLSSPAVMAELPSDRPARSDATFPTRADFDDVCGPVLQLTANPNAVQQNTMVRLIARRYPAVDNREILSAMRRWFRKRREEMSQRIYSSCRRHIAEQPMNRNELVFFMERLRADVPLIDRIRREAHVDITEERESRAFTLDKVENYLQKQMEEVNGKASKEDPNMEA